MAIQELENGALYSVQREKINANDTELDTRLGVIEDATLDTRVTALEEKSGVFAALSAADDTTITTAGTYVPVEGTFTNMPAENFEGGTQTIDYKGTVTTYFEIDWHATLETDGASTTVSIGVKKNGALEDSSVMTVLCKTAGEKYTVSGTVVVELETDDTIQLVATTDGAGDVITFDNFTTTISKFFNN